MSVCTVDRPHADGRQALPSAADEPPRHRTAERLADPALMPLERVEAELCTLAGQIAAATSRFLTLLADFDAREGWAGWGVHSCAHWLSWRCGLSLHTAHEHVRIARALAGLPKTAAAFAQGRISYSKVRAICRVATAVREEELLDAALHSPAAHLERLVRGMVRAQRNLDDERRRRDGSAATSAQRMQPRVQWRWDDDGRLKIWGELDAEDGARLLAGLSRMDQQRRRTDRHVDDHGDDRGCAEAGPAGPNDPQRPCAGAGDAAPEGGPCGGLGPAGPSQPSEPSHPGTAGVAPANLGPALVAGAELMCTAVDSPVHAPATDVVVHVDADTLVETACRAAGPADGRADDAAALPATSRADRRHAATPPRLDDGPALRHRIVHMLACDGRIQLSVRAGDGRTLNLGRRRRRPNRAQLDALWRRDRGCAHPGCGRTRFLHAHHVTPWAAAGRTDRDNLVLLCGEHHRALHEGEFGILALGRQRFRFHGPRGAERPQAPSTRGTLTDLTGAYPHIRPTTIEPDWDGTPLHPPHATDVFLTNWAVEAARRAGDTGGST